MDSYNAINRFHTASGGFYFIYGLICIFFYRPYCRNYYFTQHWTTRHDTDKPLNYMMIGAGECCIVMAILTHYIDIMIELLYIHVKPPRNCIFTSINAYLIMQMWIWVTWTCTEAYYTWIQVETTWLGIVHVIMCLFVLYLNMRIQI